MNRFLNRDFLTEPLKWVPTLQLFKFNRSVLIQELVNAEVATSHSDLNLVLFNPNVDFLASELVSALALPHEHHFQLVSIRVVVDKLCHLLVNWIALDGDIDGNPSLQFDDVALQGSSFVFQVSHSDQEV